MIGAAVGNHYGCSLSRRDLLRSLCPALPATTGPGRVDEMEAQDGGSHLSHEFSHRMGCRLTAGRDASEQ